MTPRSSDSPKPGRELCSCGHRASSHVVGKYACQAPGGYKGYCPCMRFIPGKSSSGSKRQFPKLLAAGRK